ncbi:MAG TPA: hypothetical protein VFC63_05805 [Blastocatellia bacterium]|nr:hypothetical protein [Blastocatellia bacterium]
MKLKPLNSGYAQRFRAINERCMGQMTSDCAMLVDHEISINLSQFGTAEREVILASSLRSMAFVKFEMAGAAEPVSISLLVDLTAGGNLTRLLRRMTVSKSPITSFDADDRDCFVEIVNVLRGALNLAIDEQTGSEYAIRDISLEIPGLKEVHDYAQIFFAEKSYIVAEAKLKIADAQDSNVYLIWDCHAIESMFGPDPADKRTVILLQRAEREVPFRSSLINVVSYDLDGKKMEQVRDFIIEHKEACAALVTSGAIGEATELCHRIKTDYANGYLNVIALMDEPTESTVLAAIETGVDDIIALPAAAEFIEQRVDRLTAR